jgi:hypothetical protein
MAIVGRWPCQVYIAPTALVGNTSLEGRNAKVQQDESYPPTGDLSALNTSRRTSFALDTHRARSRHLGSLCVASLQSS